MDISAKITGIKYSPFLCRKLNCFSIGHINEALSKDGSFILSVDEQRNLAISWWVSAKRTRSYPYARVYDSLSFQGKKATIIPIMKDEGKEGDRDFLQWDTISLMSLLGVYTIICYYTDAEKNPRYRHKITNQRFDIPNIKEKIYELLSYQSDALHWNLSQIDKAGEIGQKAVDSYEKISRKLDIEINSKDSALRRVQKLLKGRDSFMNFSRTLAKKAQNRESLTLQPKEKVSGIKATLTIKNYLGGFYFFTCDEVEFNKEDIYLIECKHSKDGVIPLLGDIKDGLMKMILFTNLEEVKIGSKEYSPISVLKLTSNMKFQKEELRKSQLTLLQLLKKEAEENNFKVLINDIHLEDLKL